MKFSCLLLFAVLTVSLGSETSASSTSNEDTTVFSNPSTRISASNRQTRMEKLTEAYEAQQRAILSQIVWHVDPNKPIERVEVRIGEQKLYAFQNNVAVAISPVSTARQGYVTPVGSYTISDKKESYFSNLYGEFEDANGNVVDWSADPTETPPPGAHYVPSPMPYFLRLTDGGVGLHAGYLPGFPASHGCIRLPTSVAENIFRLVSIGTRVDVVQ